jgi:hypothetical protein
MKLMWVQERIGHLNEKDVERIKYNFLQTVEIRKDEEKKKCIRTLT